MVSKTSKLSRKKNKMTNLDITKEYLVENMDTKTL